MARFDTFYSIFMDVTVIKMPFKEPLYHFKACHPVLTHSCSIQGKVCAPPDDEISVSRYIHKLEPMISFFLNIFFLILMFIVSTDGTFWPGSSCFDVFMFASATVA